MPLKWSVIQKAIVRRYTYKYLNNPTLGTFQAKKDIKYENFPTFLLLPPPVTFTF